jgi:hypothetical protein
VEYENKTRPVLDYYPKEKIHRVDATMSQIRVLSDILKVLVPIKEKLDAQQHIISPPMRGNAANANSAAATAAVADGSASPTSSAT